MENILLFIPFGFFLKWHGWKKTAGEVLCASFFLSLLIEALQVISMAFSLSHGRIFDADDIIANVAGGMIGFGLFVLLKKIIHSGLFAGEAKGGN